MDIDALIEEGELSKAPFLLIQIHKRTIHHING